MSHQDPFLISTEELAARLGDPKLALFDASAGPVPTAAGEVPAGEAFRQAHIPTARWIDQAELSDRTSPYGYMAPSAAATAAYFERLGVSAWTTVVLYSASSHGWAARVWWLLRSIGFDNARLLDGGLKKWRDEDRLLGQGPADAEPPARGHIEPRPREVFVGRERVLQAVERGDAHLVDALGAAQYSGEAAGKYGRRGHIAGAVNVPNSGLVAADNTFKEPAVAAALLEGAGVGRDKPLITYCGGGIAASIDAFAALRAGYDDVRIYDASLAEWAADASLPMEPGTP